MTHTDIKLFFCLQGEMQITCGDRISYLKKDSFGAVFYPCSGQ